MLRKSLIVALGFLGLVLAGTAAGTQPASAGYSCGPWNNWCGPRLWAYPGYSFGWFRHGHKHWNKSYSHRHWNKGQGRNHHQAYKHKGGKHYR
jgi:hypothetical protein